VTRSGAHLDDPPREVAVGHRIRAGVRASSAMLRRRRCLEAGAGEGEQSVGGGNGEAVGRGFAAAVYLLLCLGFISALSRYLNLGGV
jgi:hypothetical protein